MKQFRYGLGLGFDEAGLDEAELDETVSIWDCEFKIKKWTPITWLKLNSSVLAKPWLSVS